MHSRPGGSRANRLDSDETHDPSPKKICRYTPAFAKNFRKFISKISTCAAENRYMDRDQSFKFITPWPVVFAILSYFIAVHTKAWQFSNLQSIAVGISGRRRDIVHMV